MEQSGSLFVQKELSFKQEGSTRQTVLTLLKTQGQLNAAELARQLDITEMAVRRHLSTLERDGLISPIIVRQAMGRPTHRFQLTEQAEHLFPKNYHVLALDLLEELEDAPETAVLVERLFEGRKRKLLERYAFRMEGKTLKEKVIELAAIQNDGGYMVQLQEDEEVLVLNEYNCPIAQVAKRYQHACQCELALFEQLLEAEVERSECLAKGGEKCSYRITHSRS
ncbi:DeoR family transcriptional regulator [Paenibacillus baekrokdamisoli]|uniref:DeoR family transcriptional regulator n=1 Tax=Paenibacillus baekrokdamisoli TaxID=1712516 RepID=A0A3G9J5U0_9BACL|nr:HTH domain-containing protein [Paenibacillus baekrokdamisoli]MBB3067718.1 putative ArsR family transcriptional regulator [Paenibacillus baekrokdamisoli]BBH19098.1 DeoR family transcriptional regulator [Paenibacillus baekrokdamisoli]